MSEKLFTGTGVALVTPFKKDLTVDHEALERIIEDLLSNGIDFLVALGTTAETPTLSQDEKDEILDTVIKANNKRVPILVGAGSNSTQGTVENIQRLNSKAIDGYLVVAPYYNKPSQVGMIAHFASAANATDKQIVLYNVPGRTSSNILPSTVIELAKSHGNIVAIKEASGSIDQNMEIVANKPANFYVLSGEDALTLPLISVGIEGVISVMAQGMPRDYSDLVEKARNNDYDSARKIHYKLLPFIQYIFEQGNPAGIKHILMKKGLCGDTLRLPLVNIEQDLKSKIDRAIERF